VIAKDLEQITEDTLKELKDNKVLEGKTIEYKQKLNLINVCKLKFIRIMRA